MNKYFSIFVIIFLFGSLVVGLYADDSKNTDVFQEIERIQLNFGDFVFARITDIEPSPEGFILAVKDSAFGNLYSLVKLSGKGKYLCHYDKRGNGPGELRNIDHIAVSDEFLFVSESNSPYIHKFSHNLEFIQDYRVKRGGGVFLLGSYIGSWGVSFTKVGGKDKTHLLQLYDKNKFEYKKDAFDVSEIPPYVFSWGGMCQVNENTFAGVYCNQFKVFLFDRELNVKGSLISDAPKYVKEYYKWKGDSQTFDSNTDNWLSSWTKMHSIYYVDNKLIVIYMINRKQFIDVYSLEGKPLVKNYLSRKNRFFSFTQDSYCWWLERNDDSTEFTLIKTKIKLD
jgi:hypothetical protein